MIAKNNENSNSSVEARENSHVEARGNSSVEAWGNRLGPENTTSKQALDYLFRKGLQGSQARDTALTQIESEKVVEG